MTLGRLLKLIYTSAIFCLLSGVSSKATGQVDAQLLTLNSHFAGVWVGTSDNYVKMPMVTRPVRIEIKDNPKKRELRLEYWYGIKGQKTYEHLVRYMTIHPAKSSVDLAWQYESTEHFQARGLDGVLGTGYGDFTLANTFHADAGDVTYRCVFHIEADRFTYKWATSNDGVKFYKEAEWILTREGAEASSPSP